MENSAASCFGEISLTIWDGNISHYGGSQNWFPKKKHRLSGCGPIAAANITAYLSRTFPDKFYPLYPYEDVLNKQDFVEHMIAVRKYVIPGMFGLTSVRQFADNVLAFACQRGVTLTPHILDDDAASMEDALTFITEGLSQKTPVSILVLKHPVKELEEYTWHWMTITDLKLEPQSSTYFIVVSTYGERREINLDLLWNHRRRQDIIRLAYFT